MTLFYYHRLYGVESHIYLKITMRPGKISATTYRNRKYHSVYNHWKLMVGDCGLCYILAVYMFKVEHWLGKTDIVTIIIIVMHGHYWSLSSHSKDPRLSFVSCKSNLQKWSLWPVCRCRKFSL